MKILVIHATAGAGHRRAAEAIYGGFKSSTNLDVTLVDSLDYTNRFYKKFYSKTYTLLISKTPWLWAFVFHLIDIPWLLPLVRLARRIQNSLNAQPLSRFLQKENFDYIFSTHFFPNEVAACLKRKGKIRSVVISSITDFDVHSIWLADGIDLYTVASEWTQKKMLRLGVPEDKIVVSGIPTDENFSRPMDILELKTKACSRRQALYSFGGYGVFWDRSH